MQSVYSWLGSPIQLMIEDDVADAYNSYVDAFAKAQVTHKERTGRDWSPSESLLIDTTTEAVEAHNGIGGIINALIKLNGGGIELTEEQCPSDYLVKVD